VTSTEQHWEAVWRDRAPEEMSWFQDAPTRSLELIRAAAPEPAAPIVDVGGGASRLVDRLLAAGYADLTVLDISAAALGAAKQRLGADATRVEWVHDDVLTHRFERRFRVWHDRAVFHFLVGPADQRQYVERLLEAVAPDGHVIIATFGPQGPTHCSGLPVQRYDRAAITAALGPEFAVCSYTEDVHHTPAGATQQFAYCDLRRRGA
jgi:2-polyprenyl-3-methyl-5-hydroxy-6-metoxy-1,4-benzoquinol methylase